MKTFRFIISQSQFYHFTTSQSMVLENFLVFWQIVIEEVGIILVIAHEILGVISWI